MGDKDIAWLAEDVNVIGHYAKSKKAVFMKNRGFKYQVGQVVAVAYSFK